MPATSCGISLSTVQTAAEIAADGALLPYGFEYETNGDGGTKKYRWVRLKTAIDAEQGELVATEQTTITDKDGALILAAAGDGTGIVRGAAVEDIPANGAGWVQFYGEASVFGTATAGSLIKAGASGLMVDEAVVTTPTVFTIGVSHGAPTAALGTVTLWLD